jgi:hypothetical protein
MASPCIDMRLEDYTPDAICQAMKLPGFIEPSWMEAEQPTLRVLLTPSFTPELCITVFGKPEATVLSIVALAEQFWSQRGEGYSLSNGEELQLPSGVFEEVHGLFHKAHGAPAPDNTVAYCDGMGSELCLVSRAGTRRLSAHLSAHHAARELIARLIDVAWSTSQLPKIRNALAQAAAYLDKKYPLQEVAPESSLTRLAVLGTPEDRRDYLAALKRHKKDKD